MDDEIWTHCWVVARCDGANFPSSHAQVLTLQDLGGEGTGFRARWYGNYDGEIELCKNHFVVCGSVGNHLSMCIDMTALGVALNCDVIVTDPVEWVRTEPFITRRRRRWRNLLCRR